MRRLLVVARAATCLRVARTAREHGLSVVGVVTSTDRDARWTEILDDAVEVPSYTDVPALIDAAARLDAQVLHPGVGFVAESAQAARACQRAGLTWIGPSPEALETLTDKVRLAQLARDLGVPVPETIGPLTGAAELARALRHVGRGSPGSSAVVKTVQGGGGRGVVYIPDPASAQADRLWELVQGLGPILLQTGVDHARHVEVQGIGDGHTVVTAGTRECSVQRRSQKLIEEAPAPDLSAHCRQILEERARAVLEAVAYRGVGTCEFLVVEDQALLLEVNARLQVEHAVTESVTGVDLVRAQLRLAEGSKVWAALTRPLDRPGPVGHCGPLDRTGTGDHCAQQDHCDPHNPADVPGTSSRHEHDTAHATHPSYLETSGHAIQARVYAEDPVTLLPQSDDLLRASIPVSLASQRERLAATMEDNRAHRDPSNQTTLRSEQGIMAGDQLSENFSEPIALMSVHAPTRAMARDGLDQALSEVDVVGPATLVPLLRDVLAHTDFAASPYQVTTRWLENTLRPDAARASHIGTLDPAASATPVRTAAPAHHTPSTTPHPSAPRRCVTSADTRGEVPLADPFEVRAPMPGTLVDAPRQGKVSTGEVVAVLEAMKMRLPVPAPRTGLLRPAPELQAGSSVQSGQVLAVLNPLPPHAREQDSPHTLRPVPSHGHSRMELGSAAPPGRDEPGTSAADRAEVTVRRRRPHRSATDRLTALADPGSVRDLINDDAVATAWAQLNGREVAVWAQDPTVAGGTIGLAGSRRVAALITQAAARRVPVIALIDGGGARVQEGSDALAGVGLILAAQADARGRTIQIGVVLGPAAGGAAYAPALTDILIQVAGAGQIFLTGPAVLAASTGEQINAEELGGSRLHAHHAGTSHLVVPDEPGAWAAIRQLVTYAPLARRQPLATGTTAPIQPASALPWRPGGNGPLRLSSDLGLGRVVPADPRAPYDVRDLLHRLTDRGELLELRPDWAAHLVTGLARIDGIPVGILASQPQVMAGVLDAVAAQKGAEHLELCARLRLPLVVVVDTPGFLPGQQAEAAGTVRLGARLVEQFARYRSHGGPILTVITRRAFGGAYVALGSAALSGARVAAWSQATIGVMDPRLEVGIIARRQLARATASGMDASALHDRLVRRRRQAQGAHAVAQQGWAETVIDPPATRAWLAAALDDAVAERAVTLAPLAHIHHPGDGWVTCTCGSRHWGTRGAAGLLVWRQTRDGIDVLLQLRSTWTHEGGTWGIPGGALAAGESPAQAALREVEEETGLPCRVLRLTGTHVQDHGAWRYTTLSAQASPSRAWDRLLSLDGESAALAWVPLRSDAGSWLAPAPDRPRAHHAPLLPALTRVWPELARLLPPPGMTAIGTDHT